MTWPCGPSQAREGRVSFASANMTDYSIPPRARQAATGKYTFLLPKNSLRHEPTDYPRHENSRCRDVLSASNTALLYRNGKSDQKQTHQLTRRTACCEPSSRSSRLLANRILAVWYIQPNPDATQLCLGAGKGRTRTIYAFTPYGESFHDRTSPRVTFSRFGSAPGRPEHHSHGHAHHDPMDILHTNSATEPLSAVSSTVTVDRNTTPSRCCLGPSSSPTLDDPLKGH